MLGVMCTRNFYQLLKKICTPYTIVNHEYCAANLKYRSTLFNFRTIDKFGPRSIFKRHINTGIVSVPPFISDEFAFDPSDLSRPPQIVIIGAGASGLAAAHKLVQAGLKEVKILEASGRVGGRVNTVELGNSVVDLGAQYLFRGDENPLMAIAIQEGLVNLPSKCPVEDLDIRTDYKNVTFVKPQARSIDFDTVKVANKIFSQVENKAKQFAKTKHMSRSYGNAEDYFKKSIEAEIAGCPVWMRTELKTVASTLIKNLENKFGAPITDVSSDFYGSAAFVSSKAEVVVGMSGVLEPFVRVLNSSMVEHFKEVVSVSFDPCYEGDVPRATVQCSDGSKYPADYVIISIPLAILKKQASQMFSPPLPKRYVEGFNDIGVGQLTKVFLDFEIPFWMPGDGNFFLTVEDTSGEAKCDQPWYKGIVKIDQGPSREMLQFTVGGQAALKLETLTDAEIVRDLVTVLKHYFNDSTFCVRNILRTSWGTHPFFQGAVSYFRVGSSKHSMTVLSEPVLNGCTPIFYFIGEYLSPDYYGTVSGAVKSGTQAAASIIGLTRMIGGAPMPSVELPGR